MTGKQMTTKAKQNNVTVNEDLPDYLRDVPFKPGLEGVDTTDLKIPRIKLLQALSPEVQEYPGSAMPGTFWSTALKQSLGNEFEAVICLVQKRVYLWAPRGANPSGLLAVARDGVHWDKPNQAIEVDVKNVGKVVYHTKENVQRSGLLEWGSSVPGNPKSKPAATLTYEYLIYPLSEDLQMPSVISLYRTGLEPARELNTALVASRKPATAIRMIIHSKLENNGVESWYNWRFRMNGLVDKQTYHICNDLAQRHGEFEVDMEAPAEMDVGSVTAI